jgi:DNA-binding NtrC family response regulator
MAELRRILIVDDEPSVLTLLRAAFEGRPWRVQTCASAQEAEPLLATGNFDLLVTDKNMPGMSGIDLIRNLRARGSRIPVIVITGYASADSATTALNLDIAAYIEKPFSNIFDLPVVVERVLAEQQRRVAGARPPPPTEAPGLDILVVSADRILAGALTSGDQVLYVAAEGALRLLAQRSFDLIVVDGHNSRADPLEVLHQLKTAARGAELALVSDRMRLAAVKRLIELRVRTFIDSPADSDAQLASLRQLLAATRERKRVKALFAAEAREST